MKTVTAVPSGKKKKGSRIRKNEKKARVNAVSAQSSGTWDVGNMKMRLDLVKRSEVTYRRDAFVHLSSDGTYYELDDVGEMPEKSSERINCPNVQMLILVEPLARKFVKNALDRIHGVVIGRREIRFNMVINDVLGRPLRWRGTAEAHRKSVCPSIQPR